LPTPRIIKMQAWTRSASTTACANDWLGGSGVVLSDLHLGASNARPGDLLRFLDELQPRRIAHLVINGDMFDDAALSGVDQKHLAVVDRLREMNRADVRVTVTRGNHDPDAITLRTLLACNACDEVIVESAGKQFLVCHGDRWDRSLGWPSLVVNGADYVYRFSQRIDPSHRLARALKHRCKWFVRATTEVQRGAIDGASARGCDGAMVGHTHAALDVTSRGVRYLNSGCWTERPMGYLRFGDDVPSGAELRLWTPPVRAFFSSLRRSGRPSSLRVTDMPEPTP
jgi:UDP-2,3-diacylglucosamine pyrophosphatase LpxH